MKIKVSSFCWDCYETTDKTPKEYSRLKQELGGDDIEVEFNDENLYEVICPKGHVTITQLQSEKFELLFDIGTMALLDGYTKECVSTLASAFERFVEFYIKVIVAKNDIKLDKFTQTWRNLSKQSERQIGAFYMLQLLEYGETKFILDEKRASFRNKVIHQGYVPSMSEAISYGEYILQLICNVLESLRENDSWDHILKAQMFSITKNGILTKNARITNSSIPTIISLRSLQSDDFGKFSFTQALESIRDNGFYKHFYGRNFSH